MGDGTCDYKCNTQECEFDKGDCGDGLELKAFECARGCNWDQLGDGICNRACHVEGCSYDYDDCPWDTLECSPGCEWYQLGDGVCDEACKNSACRFDYVDCEQKFDGWTTATCSTDC